MPLFHKGPGACIPALTIGKSVICPGNDQFCLSIQPHPRNRDQDHYANQVGGRRLLAWGPLTNTTLNGRRKAEVIILGCAV